MGIVDKSLILEAMNSVTADGLPSETKAHIEKHLPDKNETRMETHKAGSIDDAHRLIHSGLQQGHHIVIKKGGKTVVSVHPSIFDKTAKVVYQNKTLAAPKSDIVERAKNTSRATENDPEAHIQKHAIARAHMAVDKHGGYGDDVTIHHISTKF